MCAVASPASLTFMHWAEMAFVLRCRYFVNEHILQMKDAQAKETSGKSVTDSRSIVAQEQSTSA
jgi:hypothetical protein